MTDKQLNKLQVTLGWGVVALFLIGAGVAGGMSNYSTGKSIAGVCNAFALCLGVSNFFRMISFVDKPTEDK